MATIMWVFGDAGGGVLASGVASRALFALLPGLLLLVAAVGFVWRDPAAQQRVLDYIGTFVPPVQELLADSVRIIADGALQMTVVGLVTLLWAASGFFQTLQLAFAVVLRSPRRRDPVMTGVVGILAVLAVFLLIMAVVGLGFLASSVVKQALGFALDDLAARVVVFGGTATAMAIAMVAAYRFIPTHRMAWAAIVPPAVAVGLGFALLTEIFTVLAPFLAGAASLYGAIAAVFVLLAWLQLAAQLVVMGIAWVRIRDEGGPPRSELPWPTGDRGRPGSGPAAGDAPAPGDATAA